MLTYVQKQFISSSHLMTIPPPYYVFAKQLQTATILSMSVRLSALNSATPIGYIFGKFHFLGFY
jgi:hypothetical protein